MEAPQEIIIKEISMMLLKFDGFAPVDGNWSILFKSKNPRARGARKKARLIYNAIERLNKKYAK